MSTSREDKIYDYLKKDQFDDFVATFDLKLKDYWYKNKSWLHWAIYFNNKKIIKFLLNQGSSLYTKDREGRELKLLVDNLDYVNLELLVSKYSLTPRQLGFLFRVKGASYEFYRRIISLGYTPSPRAIIHWYSERSKQELELGLMDGFPGVKNIWKVPIKKIEKEIVHLSDKNDLIKALDAFQNIESLEDLKKVAILLRELKYHIPFEGILLKIIESDLSEEDFSWGIKVLQKYGLDLNDYSLLFYKKLNAQSKRRSHLRQLGWSRLKMFDSFEPSLEAAHYFLKENLTYLQWLENHYSKKQITKIKESRASGESILWFTLVAKKMNWPIQGVVEAFQEKKWELEFFNPDKYEEAFNYLSRYSWQKQLRVVSTLCEQNRLIEYVFNDLNFLLKWAQSRSIEIKTYKFKNLIELLDKLEKDCYSKEYLEEVIQLQVQEKMEGVFIENCLVYVPKSGQDLVKIGQRMNNCIGKGVYLKKILSGCTNVIVLVDSRGEYKYCVEFTDNNIIQARGVNNEAMSEDLISKVQTRLERLAS